MRQVPASKGLGAGAAAVGAVEGYEPLPELLPELLPEPVPVPDVYEVLVGSGVGDQELYVGVGEEEAVPLPSSPLFSATAAMITVATAASTARQPAVLPDLDGRWPGTAGAATVGGGAGVGVGVATVGGGAAAPAAGAIRKRTATSAPPARTLTSWPSRQPEGIRKRVTPPGSDTGRITPWAACSGVIVSWISCEDTGCSKG
ncbi:hypothetical protein GCM10017778_48520 [Streptomyces vinaceus]|nr:hypothetical protein GCM10017778_48520 [Streptomyces vinaceus]